ncbi:energy transducer TonB [Granulicella cerasi]|uniref:Energy transducer TonB n=1 Tax=Granulicella cerasi TaxID=741063 RepID=A0ABW1Z9H2_9BACT|nr:energy transducer TonB [Granulicella cerasi]
MTDFERLLDDVVTRSANVEAPRGLEQRLLARLEQSARPALANVVSFDSAAKMQPKRSAASAWTAISFHAAAILLIAFVVLHSVKTQVLPSPQVAVMHLLEAPAPPPPPALRRRTQMGGGGGQKGPTPATQGQLPKFSAEQLMPPKAPPMFEAKLAVEPTVVGQNYMVDGAAPVLGQPTSTFRGYSLGNGAGTGIGSGNGAGVGPGSGGNMGGGVYKVGGAVHAPLILHSVEPEFSEEARKAKFSGNVIVEFIVDEQGLPQNVHAARDVGFGLGQKAVEAVKQYKFKPAMKDGKPVKVQMAVEVNFQIF